MEQNIIWMWVKMNMVGNTKPYVYFYFVAMNIYIGKMSL